MERELEADRIPAGQEHPAAEERSMDTCRVEDSGLLQVPWPALDRGSRGVDHTSMGGRVSEATHSVHPGCREQRRVYLPLSGLMV